MSIKREREYGRDLEGPCKAGTFLGFGVYDFLSQKYWMSTAAPELAGTYSPTPARLFRHRLSFLVMLRRASARRSIPFSPSNQSAIEPLRWRFADCACYRVLNADCFFYNPLSPLQENRLAYNDLREWI